MTCSYCVDGSGTCPGSNPEAGFVCTREPGHPGPHVACARASNSHHLLAWYDTGEVVESIVNRYDQERDPRY